MPEILNEAKAAEQRFRDLTPEEQMTIICNALGLNGCLTANENAPTTSILGYPQHPQTGLDELNIF